MPRGPNKPKDPSRVRRSPEQQANETISMRLGAELAGRVAAYHRSLEQLGIVGPSIVPTVKELIAAGIAGIPGDPEEIERSDRIRIINEYRRWILSRIFVSLREMESDLDLNARHRSDKRPDTNIPPPQEPVDADDQG